MTYTERMKALEIAETRAAYGADRAKNDIQFRKWQSVEFRIWAKMRKIRAHFYWEQVDELWPNGLPPHP